VAQRVAERLETLDVAAVLQRIRRKHDGAFPVNPRRLSAAAFFYPDGDSHRCEDAGQRGDDEDRVHDVVLPATAVAYASVTVTWSNPCRQARVVMRVTGVDQVLFVDAGALQLPDPTLSSAAPSRKRRPLHWRPKAICRGAPRRHTGRNVGHDARTLTPRPKNVSPGTSSRRCSVA
jgi:hypothetical protein